MEVYCENHIWCHSIYRNIAALFGVLVFGYHVFTHQGRSGEAYTHRAIPRVRSSFYLIYVSYQPNQCVYCGCQYALAVAVFCFGAHRVHHDFDFCHMLLCDSALPHVKEAETNIHHCGNADRQCAFNRDWYTRHVYIKSGPNASDYECALGILSTVLLGAVYRGCYTAVYV